MFKHLTLTKDITTSSLYIHLRIHTYMYIITNFTTFSTIQIQLFLLRMKLFYYILIKPLTSVVIMLYSKI